MRRCDGIFFANFRGWAARATRSLQKVGLQRDLQPTTRSAAAKKHDQVRRCARKLFSLAGQSSSVSRLTTRTQRRRKRALNFFWRVAFIHRSGGKLLDNLGLTSRARSGSLHVDWFARSLINSRAVRPLNSVQEKIKMRSEVFRDGYPDSSLLRYEESPELERSHRRRNSHVNGR